MSLVLNFTTILNYANSSRTSSQTVLSAISQFLNTYYIMFIILIGLIGNSITIVIFWRTTLTHTKKTSFYLISLALSDIGFLVILFFKYWDDHQVLMTFSKHVIACKLSVYLGYIFNFLSCSLIFTFTLQRLLVICFPLRVNFLNLERGSKILVVLLFLFACLFYSVTLLMFDIKIHHQDNSTKICTAKDGSDHQVEQFNFLDSLFTLIIPFFGLLIMNAIIIKTLRKSSYNFVIRTSNNHFTFEPNNSLDLVNRRNSENFHKIRDGMSTEFKRMGLQSQMRRKSFLKHSFFSKKSNHYEHESINDSAMIDQVASSGSSCFNCASFGKSELKVTSFNSLSKNQFPKSSCRRHSANLHYNSSIRVKEDNEKKNSPELSSLLGKQNDLRTRNSFRIGGSKTNSVSRKVTKMLIVVSTTFLILNLPVHSINVFIAIRIFITGNNRINSVEFELREIFHSLFYTSFSCNFLLYSISGATFRTEFKRMLVNLFKIKSKN